MTPSNMQPAGSPPIPDSKAQHGASGGELQPRVEQSAADSVSRVPYELELMRELAQKSVQRGDVEGILTRQMRIDIAHILAGEKSYTRDDVLFLSERCRLIADVREVDEKSSAAEYARKLREAAGSMHPQSSGSEPLVPASAGAAAAAPDILGPAEAFGLGPNAEEPRCET